MKNKEKKIVSLLEEGFSYDTIKKMSNTHIDLLYDRLIKEAESYNTKTKVFDLDNETDRKEFDKDANSGENNQITATDQGDVALTMKNESEISEDEDLDYSAEKGSGYNPYAGNSPGNTEGPAGNNPSPNSDGMGYIDEDAVIEDLFGSPKKKMKKPIGTLTTLGMFEETSKGTKCWKGYEKKGMKTMFGKKVPNCVKKESKEEKISHLEESIVSLIKKSQGKMLTKKDILSEQPKIAPAEPTVKPGVKPKRGTPYKPKHSPKPKAGTEIKPAEPTVKPGVKPERGNPYKPKHSPKPKAGEEQGLPEFLKFDNLNIKFKDE